MAVNKPTGDNARKGVVKSARKLRPPLEAPAPGLSETKARASSWLSSGRAKKETRRPEISSATAKQPGPPAA